MRFIDDIVNCSEVAALKILRFPLGVNMMERIIKEYIRRTAKGGQFRDKVSEANYGLL